MPTELELKFYKHFGIEPKIFDGCKLADEYWKNEELASGRICFDDYMNKNCNEYNNGDCSSFCEYAYDDIQYPKITDDILLKIMCCNSEKSRKELKNEILKKAIQIAGDNEYKKKQIRELFNDEEQ